MLDIRSEQKEVQEIFFHPKILTKNREIFELFKLIFSMKTSYLTFYDVHPEIDPDTSLTQGMTKSQILKILICGQIHIQ